MTPAKRGPDPVWNTRLDFVCESQAREVQIFLVENNTTIIGHATYLITPKNFHTHAPFEWIEINTAASNTAVLAANDQKSPPSSGLGFAFNFSKRLKGVVADEKGSSSPLSPLSPLSPSAKAVRIQAQVIVIDGNRIEKDHAPQLANYSHLTGVLVCGLVRAADLVYPTPRRLHRPLARRVMRPFVAVEFGLEGFRSRTIEEPNIDKAKAPEFNQECRFWVRDNMKKYVLRLTIYNRLGPKQQEIIGRAYIDGSGFMTGQEHRLVVNVHAHKAITDVDSVSSSNEDLLDFESMHFISEEKDTGLTMSSRSISSTSLSSNKDPQQDQEEFGIETDTLDPNGTLGSPASLPRTRRLSAMMPILPSGAPTTTRKSAAQTAEAPIDTNQGAESSKVVLGDNDPLRFAQSSLDHDGSALTPLEYEEHISEFEEGTPIVARLYVQLRFSPKDQVEKWLVQRVLHEFDMNNDGRLSQDEAMDVLKIMGLHASTNDKAELLARLTSPEDNRVDEDQLIKYLTSAEFHANPMSYTLLTFLTQGTEAIRTLDQDLYRLCSDAPRSLTRAGAGLLEINEGLVTVKDWHGMKVMNRETGLIVDENIPKYVFMALQLLYLTGTVNRVKKVLARMTHREGLRMDHPDSAKKIPGFIKLHKMNPKEWLEEDPSQYPTFNAFFYRHLKPDARPIQSGPGICVSPADSRLLAFTTVHESTTLWIKGTGFIIDKLLTDQLADITPKFYGGSVVIARLAPQDYHRYHIPVDGVMGRCIDVPGSYYTVNPIAIRQKFNVFTENRRVLQELDSPDFGKVMICCIGATMVGSVVMTAKPGEAVRAGDELGYFAFGGSTLVVLFEPGRIVFDQDLRQNSRRPLETYVRMGVQIGRCPHLIDLTPVANQ